MVEHENIADNSLSLLDEINLRGLVVELVEPVVELVDWRTAESEVSGSNPLARF